MKKEFPLTLPQLKTVWAEDWDFLVDKILHNCLCHTCKTQTTIVEFKIVVNDLNDIILKGHCATCGDTVNRYTETGENEDYVRRIKEILKGRR